MSVLRAEWKKISYFFKKEFLLTHFKLKKYIVDLFHPKDLHISVNEIAW